VLLALGLDSKMSAPVLPCERITFVHGEQDRQSPVERARMLAHVGYTVHIVPGSHGLAEPAAREVIIRVLSEYCAQLERNW